MMRRWKERRVLHRGRWLEFCEVSFDDTSTALPVTRTYECFDRVHQQQGDVSTVVGADEELADGVDVVALAEEGATGKKSLVLIEQYRPAVDRMVLELPAGLVERGEQPEAAALRELTEETGFVADAARVQTVSPLLHADPSITSDSTVVVVVQLDLSDPRNAATARTQHLDEDEHITVRLVPLATLRSVCDDYARRGWVVDAKVYQLALGLELAAIHNL